MVFAGTLAVVFSIWFGLDEHSLHIRLAFLTFAVAIVGWVFTRINDTYIALAAAMTFAVVGIEKPEDFFSSLGDSMVWLLLAAFFVAVSVKQSGLAQRLALAVAAKTRSVEGLFYALTAVIIATAFFIPSTSGRAALMLPVFMVFASVLPGRVVRALAILFPTAILLSAVASLIGAGAHLITADVVMRMGGERLDFFRWMVLGAPLALVSTFMSTWVILRLFLTREERGQHFSGSTSLASTPGFRTGLPRRLSAQEWYVLGVVLVLVGLWMSQSLHGINNTLVALLGAMAVTLPRFGNISFKEGLKGVEWNILLFMAATLELGEALVESGAARLMVDSLFSSLQNSPWSSPWAVVGIIILISLLSHLVIVSRSARSTVLVPLVVVLAIGLGYSSTALAFIATAAAGFCLTLMVSAKPLGLYAQMERPTFNQADLFRLSSVLLPLHAVLLGLFAFVIWPAMGLSLERKPLPVPPPPVWQSRPAILPFTPPKPAGETTPIPQHKPQPASATLGAAPGPGAGQPPGTVQPRASSAARKPSELSQADVRRRKQQLIEENLRREQERVRRLEAARPAASLDPPLDTSSRAARSEPTPSTTPQPLSGSAPVASPLPDAALERTRIEPERDDDD
jgi:anion transporter